MRLRSWRYYSRKYPIRSQLFFAVCYFTVLFSCCGLADLFPGPAAFVFCVLAFLAFVLFVPIIYVIRL